MPELFRPTFKDKRTGQTRTTGVPSEYGITRQMRVD